MLCQLNLPMSPNCLCLMEMCIISSKMHPSFQGSGEGFRGALGASSQNVGQVLRTKKESAHHLHTSYKLQGPFCQAQVKTEQFCTISDSQGSHSREEIKSF